MDLFAFLECGSNPTSQLEKNSAEVKSKFDKMVNVWLRMHLSLKGRAEVRVTYIYSLILY